MKKGIITYIVLSITLVACIGGMAFLGYGLFFDNGVSMSNFDSASKEDVLKWAAKNKVTDLIKYEYEYSDTVDKDVVISQSIEPNEKIEGEFTITISKGSIIDLDINDYKTKTEFETFISKYPKVSVTYETDDQENENSELTRFSKNSIDIKNDELTVFLAKINDKTDNSKDKDKEKDTDTSKVLIPNNLLGMEEDKFIKKLNDLGFKNLKKDTEKYYSFTSKKDTIYSYDDGKFSTDKTINYAISLGDYVSAYDEKEYNGKKLEDAKKVADKYNKLNAHITFNTVEKETNDTNLVGKVSNCKCLKSNNNSVITCELGIKEVKTETVSSFVGQQESKMISDLKALGFKNFNKTASKYSTQYGNGVIMSNRTGNFKITETIDYTVSLGQYVPNINEYNGKTLAQANNIVNNYRNQGANITLSTNEVETNEYTNGTLYGCDSQDSNTKITCNIAKNYSRYILGSEGFIKEKSGTSYDATIANLNSYFNGKFTNVNYIPVTKAEAVGTITNVKVNGNDSYTGNIEYDSSVLIEIEICQTQLN